LTVAGLHGKKEINKDVSCLFLILSKACRTATVAGLHGKKEINIRYDLVFSLYSLINIEKSYDVPYRDIHHINLLQHLETRVQPGS